MSKAFVTRTGICIAALNTLFVLLGLAGLVFSVTSLVDSQFLVRILGKVTACHLNLQEVHGYISLAILFSSVLCFLLSAAGCLAALFLLRKVLVFYAISLLTMLATEMYFIMFFTMTDANSKTFIERGMERMIFYYNESEEDPPGITRTKAFYEMFQCCGIHNSTDFSSERYSWTLDPSLRTANFSLLIPVACCRNTSSDVTKANPSRNESTVPTTMPPNESNVSVSANPTLNATTSLRSGAARGDDFDSLKRLENIQRAYSDCLTNANATNSYTEGCLHAVTSLLREHGDELILLAVILGFLLILLLCLTMSHCLSENLETALEQTHVRYLPTRSLALPAPDGPLPHGIFQALVVVPSIPGVSGSDRGDVIVAKARTMSDITVEEVELSTRILLPSSSSRYDLSTGQLPTCQPTADLRTLFDPSGGSADRTFKMAKLKNKPDSAKQAGKRHWLLDLMKGTDSSMSPSTSMSGVLSMRGAESSSSRLLLTQRGRGERGSQLRVKDSQSPKLKITASSSLIKSYKREPDQAESPEDTYDPSTSSSNSYKRDSKKAESPKATTAASSCLGTSSTGEEKPAREEKDSESKRSSQTPSSNSDSGSFRSL